MNFSTIDIFGSTYITTENSPAISLHHTLGAAVSLVWTDATPAAGAFTAAVTDICTKAAHGFVTGCKVRVSTATTLPAGLSAGTDYYVVVLTVDTFKLSDSLVHALAGTDFKDITSTGTGAHTITPTVLAGGVVHLECSVDGSNWFDIASKTTNVTAGGSALHEISSAYYHFIRASFVCTAGQIALSGKVGIKEG